MKKHVAVLISGTGSNLKALVAASSLPDSSYEICCVLSNKPDAGGIAWAQEQGLKAKTFDHRNFATRESFDNALNEYLQSQRIDLIACAGFMRIVTPVLLTPWQGRILNIHPSLLPLYKGLNTHERAIKAGDAQAGCTVHWVTDELDSGPIIAQAKIPILQGDTPQTLAARVLLEEHKLYPAVLNEVARGKTNSQGKM